MSISTINSKITTIANYKESIRTAIANKGVSIPAATPLADYAAKISAIAISSPSTVTEGITVADIAARNIGGVLEDSSITSIASYAFTDCKLVTQASFRNVETIGDLAFNSCSSLANIYFPAAITIGAKAFFNTRVLSASFPECTVVGSSAFNYCYYLSSIYFPKVQTIEQSAFANCNAISTISFPSLTTIGTGAFYCCRFSSAYFPNVTFVGSNAFVIASLQQGYFPKLSAVGQNAFNYAYNLQSLVLRDCSEITLYGGFADCSRLISLYLLSTSVVTLDGVGAFRNTPFAGSTSCTDGNRGNIFVPESLLAGYQTATNWVYYSSLFSGLTDSQISGLIQ